MLVFFAVSWTFFIFSLVTNFLSRRKAVPVTEGDAYNANLEVLRKKIRERGGLITGKSKDQVIKELKVIRETLWKEDYADHFGQ